MKKILFVAMACVLCLGLVGGAFAYFTDVETSTSNSMSAGTLNIHISPDNVTFGNDAVVARFSSPAGLYPGQSFETLPVYIKNVGTIDIQRIYARFGNFIQEDGANPEPEGTGSVNNIGDKIILVYYAESVDSGSNWAYETFVDGLPELGQGQANALAYEQFWAARGANITVDGVITLSELVEVRNHGSGDSITSLCMLDGGNAPGPLVPGQTITFKFKFKFLESATNVYQGDIASFDVNFIAAQLATYPDESLGESVTEPLVD
jgi:predicted ribosomally synthesized peptide with SipW-like signal peptide